MRTPSYVFLVKFDIFLYHVLSHARSLPTNCPVSPLWSWQNQIFSPVNKWQFFLTAPPGQEPRWKIMMMMMMMIINLSLRLGVTSPLRRTRALSGSCQGCTEPMWWWAARGSQLLSSGPPCSPHSLSLPQGWNILSWRPWTHPWQELTPPCSPVHSHAFQPFVFPDSSCPHSNGLPFSKRFPLAPFRASASGWLASPPCLPLSSPPPWPASPPYLCTSPPSPLTSGRHSCLLLHPLPRFERCPSVR